MRGPKKKPFSDSRKNSKFKVKNWREYNDILRKRGRIDFMISENLAEGWCADNTQNRKPGAQRKYSDNAVIICLKIRCLSGLKLRQLQWFMEWIFMSSGLNLCCPDYTTLSKRGNQLDLTSLLGKTDTKFDYICIDSTGIQTYTGNEWLENKHGKQYKRRTWKKIHVVTDPKDNVLANSMTDHNRNDRSEMNKLTNNINADELLADKGYDSENICQMLRKKGIKPTIRPIDRKTKKLPETERQKSSAYQPTQGYHSWRVKNNYGRREKVENTFFRLKNAFGCQFLSRNEENMANEMTIKCQLLNTMLHIGKVISMPVL